MTQVVYYFSTLKTTYLFSQVYYVFRERRPKYRERSINKPIEIEEVFTRLLQNDSRYYQLTNYYSSLTKRPNHVHRIIGVLPVPYEGFGKVMGSEKFSSEIQQ